MKKIVILCLFVFLSGCAGPVYLAKTEAEAVKTGYQDPELAALSQKYQSLFKAIYARCVSNKMALAKDGLGFTSLRDGKGKKLNYLLVQMRPEEVNFDKNTTTGQQRLQQIVQRYADPNLRLITKQDIAPNDIDGLAFGVTWPVRDFYQCNTQGGFVEYFIAYISKSDFNARADGAKAVREVLGESEVITSLDLTPPISIRLTFQ
ncbi:MAG: hypothetical protein H6Q55_533 [Deltaproteobacteria bacterium]|jgi:hypothetical protein|nr:hypothetical protein [Deltaproteobacteria bacterium]